MISYGKPILIRRGADCALNRNHSFESAKTTNVSVGRRISFKDTASDMQSAQKSTGATYSRIKANRKSTNSNIRQPRILQKEGSLSGLLDDSYSSQTKGQLEKISEWGFDVFGLHKSTNGRALFHIILKLFQTHDLINTFKLDVLKLMTFANLVEQGYQHNPYHNAVHAADVAQAMHCYITQGKIQRTITPVEELIALVAAITHDLDHPGVNQGYLIATNSHLAAMYDNTSVLEKHHFKTAIGALHQSGLLDHLDGALREQIVEEIRSLILATDMTRQQEFFGHLKQRLDADSIDMTHYVDRHFVLQIALKCADISNPTRPWTTCKLWSIKVVDEFFRQGDYEREQNLPISNLCDRYQHSLPKIQTGFIDFVVTPLFTQFERLMFPHRILSEQLCNLTKNAANWKQITANEEVKTVKTTSANRPNSLSLTVPANSMINDIPSPSGRFDIPGEINETNVETETNTGEQRTDQSRRHSMPAIEILARSKLLQRRQSVPDAKMMLRKLYQQLKKKQRHYQSLLLDQVSGKYEDTKDIVRAKLIRRLSNMQIESSYATGSAEDTTYYS